MARLSLLPLALCVTALGAGCGGGSGRVDVPALNDEVGRVVKFSRNAQGFDYDVRVACTASDGLHFTCHVDATTPGAPDNAWDEQVTCAPKQVADQPRCVSASGFALQ